jgi:hypothetical protein
MNDQYEVYFTPGMVRRLLEKRNEFKDKGRLGRSLDFGIHLLRTEVENGERYDLRLYPDLDALVCVCEMLEEIPRHYHAPFSRALRELSFVKQDMNQRCAWKAARDDYDVWFPGCDPDSAWTFTNAGGPEGNGMTFCPFCGVLIKVETGERDGN